MKAFLTGLGTGVALGVLFAPRSGRETRDQVRSKADKLRGLAKEQPGKVQDLATGVQQRARDLGSQVKDSAASLASQTGNAGLLVRLNTASRDELMSINGIGPVTADKIIGGRPYVSTQQLVDRGILAESVYKLLLREFKAA